MKFRSLSIENFLTVGSIDAQLDDKGLVLVSGENIDDTSQNSNGSGKSSFVDALCWVLFGTTARDVTGDDVINDRVGKNCRVSVEVEADGDTFHIARHRKYTKHRNRLHLHGPSGDLTCGTDKLTQELVDKLVGATVDVFCASVYAGQENMPDLPGMGDRELKALVEESAGIRDIEAGYREARDRLNSEKASLTTANRDLEFIQRREVELEEDKESATESIVNWASGHTARLTAAKKSVGVAKNEVTVLSNVATHVRAADEIKAEIDECDAKIAAQQSERDELEVLRNKAADLQRDVNGINSAFNNGKLHLERLRKDRAKITDKLGQPCNECGRNHDSSTLGSAEDLVKRDMKSKLTDLTQLKADLKESTEALQSASDAVSAFTASMTNVSDVLQRQRDLRAEGVKSANASSDLKTAEGVFKRAASDYVKVRDEENPYEATLTTVMERQKENVAKAEHQAEMVKAGEYRVNVAEEVAGVFSPAGVRAHILDNVTPFLNSRTAHYLTALTDGNISAFWNTLGTTAKGDIREKFNIEVASTTGGNNFKKLSGGEKRKVRLATAMALQDLVASRATKPIDLFIADEVDAALDEAGLERLMGLLHDKAKDVGTVLVISHSDLKSWISNSVTIVKEGGQARLEGVALNGIS